MILSRLQLIGALLVLGSALLFYVHREGVNQGRTQVETERLERAMKALEQERAANAGVIARAMDSLQTLFARQQQADNKAQVAQLHLLQAAAKVQRLDSNTVRIRPDTGVLAYEAKIPPEVADLLDAQRAALSAKDVQLTARDVMITAQAATIRAQVTTIQLDSALLAAKDSSLALARRVRPGGKGKMYALGALSAFGLMLLQALATR